ncbi:Protein F18E2.1 b [Aphelenchoides avenae]|nr:Protein F18E2.1 b [Aphelenchus avenae]
MVVTWVTMTKLVSDPVAEFGESPAALTAYAVGTQTDFVFNGVHRYIHRVTMVNLKPNTTYYYKVGSPQGWSHVFHFKTFPEDNDFPFRICVFGDLGVLNGTSTPYLQKAAQRGDFDIVIHIGDIAYDLHTDDGNRGDIFMRQMEPIAAYVPYMVIAGNHEDDGQNFSHYKNRFSMPNSPFGDNQVYSFDLGPIHFVAVSTEYYGFFYEYGIGSIWAQYNWLKQDLKKADDNREKTPWIVSFQHRPFYCSNENSEECASFENRLIRTGYEDFPGLEKLFLDHGMDLGFWGHEHSYERFYPVSERKVYNQTENPYHNAPAPVYVITGSAGCHSGHAWFRNPPVPGSAVRNNDYGYSILHVKNRTHLFLEQISVETGTRMVDSVWITKDDGHAPKPHVARQRRHVPFPGSPPSDSSCTLRDIACRRKRDGGKNNL